MKGKEKERTERKRGRQKQNGARRHVKAVLKDQERRRMKVPPREKVTTYTK